LELHKKYENSCTEQQHADLSNSKTIFNFKSSKTSKAWYFIENSREETKRKLILQQQDHKENNNRVASRKALSL
jgi:hypothetical protein